jgi:signal transduction histidine kinase/ActR/RegA family two-component response regulator
MTSGSRGDAPSGEPVGGARTAPDPDPRAVPPFVRASATDDVSLLAPDDGRRREAQEVLTAASAVLGRSLDLRETADAIARAAIPRFADWAIVDAADENGRLARLALAHADPVLLAAAEEIDRRWPPDFENAAASANSVLATGEPWLMSDFRDDDLAPYAHDTEHFAAWRALRVRSCVSVPLEAADERIGVLTLLATEGGRRYSVEDLPLALELARRAAAALLNARLFARERLAHADAQTARDRTERLQRLSAELTRSLTPDAVVDVVVRHVVLALGAQSAAVFELSEDGREFGLLGTANVDAPTRERAARLPVDTPYPIGEVARTGEPLLIGDSAGWWRDHPDLPMVGNPLRAWAVLPLQVPDGAGNRLLGALSVTLPGPRQYAEAERGFLQTFADLCAQALDRARMFDAEAKARVLAERLQAVIGALAGVRTPDEIAHVVGREARDAVGATVAGLGLLADDGSTFTMRCLEGADDAVRDEWSTFPNIPTIPYGAVVADRAPLFFPSLAAYVARFPDLESALSAEGLKAAALVPLTSGDGLALGAIHFDFTEPRTFSTASRQAFLSIAQQCSAALERVRLYEAERAHAAAVAARHEAETAQAVAEAASRAKDELLAFVSHELRAPLAPARTLAQVLALSDTLTPDDRETVMEIERHIAIEARLVENLVEYERAGRGMLTVQCDRCDLRDVVRRALRIAGPALLDRRIEVKEAYLADAAVAWADSLRVQEIVHNLLTNAARYSGDDTMVTVRLQNPAPGWVELAVADTGNGIAPDDLPRLFTPFTQLGGPMGHHAGLGLGLALSRRLAELQGGTLSVASEGLGRGATFTLMLRTARAETDRNSRQETDLDIAINPALTRADGGELRILVIEDDRSTAVALRRLLSAYGHEVHVADSLARAEEIVCTERLDLVLSDLQLRRESGLEVPRRLADAARRCGRPVLPAVVLSAYTSEIDIAQASAAGFVTHLAKPIDEQSLLQTLRHAALRDDDEGARPQ